MPNRWTRNSSDTLVPKVGGTKPDGSIVAAKLADDSVEGRTVDYYKSASDVTGTGSLQNIAHGLGRSPLLVIVIPQINTGGADINIVEGAHDATNVKVTAPTTTKFRVLAL
jgi:hypothetical protein